MCRHLYVLIIIPICTNNERWQLTFLRSILCKRTAHVVNMYPVQWTCARTWLVLLLLLHSCWLPRTCWSNIIADGAATLYADRCTMSISESTYIVSCVGPFDRSPSIAVLRSRWPPRALCPVNRSAALLAVRYQPIDVCDVMLLIDVWLTIEHDLFCK